MADRPVKEGVEDDPIRAPSRDLTITVENLLKVRNTVGVNEFVGVLPH